MKELFKRAWAQISLAFAVGIALLLYKDEWRLAGFVHHLGTAFVVAAIVTAFWHLREVSDVIQKYVRSMLVDFSYLTNMDIPTLMQLRSTAARAILQRNTDNPSYDRTKLENWIDSLLYERLLPGKRRLSGIYRDNCSERIAVERLTLADALREVGSPASGLSEEALRAVVVRLTTTGRFTVISPQVSDDNYNYYEFSWAGSSSGVANFPIEKQTRIFVGKDQKNAEQLMVQTKCEDGQILTTIEPKKLEFTKGICTVWLKTIEYKSLAREPFVLNTMSYLTHGIRVDIFQVGQGAPLVFVGQMIATPLNEPTESDCGVRSAHLEYDGWLFEDHGYQFYWWEASDSNTLPEPHATLNQSRQAEDSVERTHS
jgi:hypothetical protein